jgi:Cys-tRNA(Pro)/Cys-tRNA(Cys) deacylase
MMGAVRMTEKLQSMRVLDGKKIPYKTLHYPDDLRDAEVIASVLGFPPEQVFKTLVVLPPEKGKKPILALIPADMHLDLKKLAAAASAKKLKMASYREAEDMTGLQVGGISPVALINKGFMVYINSSAEKLSQVCVSAGKRGTQLQLAPLDLTKLTNARLVEIAVRGSQAPEN